MTGVTLVDLVEASRFVDVRAFSLSVELTDAGDAESARVDYTASGLRAETDQGFIHRFRVEFESSVFVGHADIGGLYHWTDGPVEVDAALVSEFATQVAFMQLFPFLRQTIHQLTTQVGAPFLPPIMQRGDVEFTFEDQPES